MPTRVLRRTQSGKEKSIGKKKKKTGAPYVDHTPISYIGSTTCEPPAFFVLIFVFRATLAARGTLGSMDFPEELANPDLVGALVKVSIICKENP